MKDNVWHSYEGEKQATEFYFGLKSDKWSIYVFFIPGSKGTMVISAPIIRPASNLAPLAPKAKILGHELTVVPTRSKDNTNPQ